MVSSVLAADIMKKDYTFIDMDESVSRAISMFSGDTDALIVMKDGEYKGMLLEKMIMNSGLDPEKWKVKTFTIMAPKLSPETLVTECARLMIENDVMKLPVFEDKGLIGIVTDDMILSMTAQRDYARKPVRDLMSKDMIIASPEDTVGKIMNAFKEYNISMMPVVKDGFLLGTVSVHDILESIAKPKKRQSMGFFMFRRTPRLKMPIEGLMNTTVNTVGPASPISNVIQEMEEGDLSSMIVVDLRGLPIGVITKKDIIEDIAYQKQMSRQIFVQISSKVKLLDRKTMMREISDFLSKYPLGQGYLYAHVTQHKEKRRGLRMLYVRLRLRCREVSTNVSADGFGEENATNNALSKLREIVVKNLEQPAINEERIAYA